MQDRMLYDLNRGPSYRQQKLHKACFEKASLIIDGENVIQPQKGFSTSACKTLTPTDYLQKHNKARNIYKHLAHKQNLATDVESYYKYTPQTILQNYNYKMYYDRQNNTP